MRFIAALQSLVALGQAAGLKIGHGEVIQAGVKIAEDEIAGKPISVALQDAAKIVFPSLVEPAPTPAAG